MAAAEAVRCMSPETRMQYMEQICRNCLKRNRMDLTTYKVDLNELNA